MSEIAYKWLNGREAAHGGKYKYALRRWTPTIENIEPCARGYHLCRSRDLPNWVSSDLFVAEYKGEPVEEEDKIVVCRCRIVEHLKGWNETTARLFAADCAERVLPLFEKVWPNDDRPRKAIESTRAYARGEISTAAWAAARAAARAAAWDAARAAARDAAWAAAWAAARDAARAAARDAARDAAWDAARAAARDAARDAEREWQGERILEYATGRIRI